MFFFDPDYLTRTHAPFHNIFCLKIDNWRAFSDGDILVRYDGEECIVILSGAVLAFMGVVAEQFWRTVGILQ